MASIVPRWLPSCHDGGYLFAKTTTEENLKSICSSQHDGTHHSTMTLLGDQADEMHRISYNFELYLPIVPRWTHRATMDPSCHDGLLRLITKTINRALLSLFKSCRNSRTLSTIKEVFGGALRA
ncbi:hypothetical protein QL285_057924 [Trifolium repens]|nr:hypothetical protein QL285_057924 [Trifolium repens]